MITSSRQQFESELARGRVYEVAVSRWLQAVRGYHTLPVFDFNGLGAPHIDGLQADGTHETLTAPDILACKAGTWAWFEVKLKACAPLHRISNTRVTGLPLRNWQHYLAVRAATITPVWLIFVHLEEQEVMAGEIGALSAHNIDTAATMDNGGTVFFQYDKLYRLMSLKTLDAYKEVQS